LETANALSDLGFVTAAGGDLARAGLLQLEALGIAERVGSRGIVAQSIDGVAGLLGLDGRAADAATLWAAAESIRREARYHLLLADRRRIDGEIARSRATIADDAWAAAWADGERLDLDAAIARARVALGTDVPSPRAAGEVAV
jgi:hypothetical protein